jgi:transcriptional regulator with XRE-family HTH domain
MDPAADLRDARLRAGLTQDQLARAAGTSQATISLYERGRKAPTLETLQRLLRATGTDLTVARSPQVRRPTAAEAEVSARTLERVLELAALLPTRHDPELRFPRLPVATP